MATKVGEGYVAITGDTKGLQGQLSGMGGLLGSKLGPAGQALGALFGNKLGAGLQESTGGAKGLVGTLTSVLGTSGAGGPWGIVAAAGAAAAAAVGVALYKMGSDFESQYRTIARTTGATGKDLDTLKTAFRDVASQTPASFGQVTTALTEVQRYTGVASKALEPLTLQLVTLSRITGTDVKTNTDAAVHAMENWSIPANQAGRSFDMLFKASQKSGTSFSDLAGTVTKFGPQMRLMGYNFSDSTAVIATFEKTGANTARIMAGLQLGAANIAASQPKATAAIQKAQAEVDKYQTALGKAKPGSAAYQTATENLAKAHDKLTAAQANAAGAGKSIPQAMNDAIKAIKDAKDPADALNLAIGTFGKRAAPQMVDAIRSGKFNFDEMKKAIDGSAGSINDTAKRTQTLGGSFGKMKNATEVAFAPLSSAVFNGINKGLISVMNQITPLMQSLGDNMPRILRTIGQVAGPYIKIIGDMFQMVTPMVKVFADAIALVSDLLHGNFKAAFKDAGALLRAFIDFLKAFGTEVLDMILAPFRALGVNVPQALASFWSFLISIPSRVLGYLSNLGASVWQAIVGGFSQAVGAGEAGIAALWGWVTGIAGRVGQFFANLGGAVWNAMVSGFQWAVGAAEAGISGLWGWVSGIAGRVGQFFANLGGAVWGALAGGFAQAVNGASAGIGALWGWVSGVAGRVGSGLAAIGGAVWGALSGGFAAAVGGAEAGISGLWGFVGGIGGRIKGALGDVASLLYGAGRDIITGLGRGIREAAQGVFDFVSGIAGKIASLKGPLDYDRVLLVPAGQAIMGGLHSALKQGMDEVSATVTAFTTGLAGTPGTPIPVALGTGGGYGTNGGGPAVVIQNATFKDQADIDQFMRQAAWVVQTQRI